MAKYSFGSSSQQDTSKKHFLDMQGRITFGKKKLDNVSVNVFIDSTKPFKTFPTDDKGYCALELPLQHFFTIKITKVGFVTKIITADTHVPKKDIMGDYLFEFSADLFEQIPDLDVSVLKFPVAKVFFNTLTKKFDYDYNYTVMINNDVKNMYHDYYLLKGKMNGSNKNSAHKTKIPASDTAKNSQVESQTTQIKNESPITFAIEVLSSGEQLPRTSPKFKGMVNIKEYQEGSLYKYFVGDYTSRDEAEKMKEKISGYFPDSSIIAFKGGKKIDMNESMKAQSK